jgi:hypothetical protein
MKLLLAFCIAATASALTLKSATDSTPPTDTPGPLPSGTDDDTTGLPPVPTPSEDVSIQYKLGFDKSCTDPMQTAILDALNGWLPITRTHIEYSSKILTCFSTAEKHKIMVGSVFTRRSKAWSLCSLTKAAWLL